MFVKYINILCVSMVALKPTVLFKTLLLYGTNHSLQNFLTPLYKYDIRDVNGIDAGLFLCFSIYENCWSSGSIIISHECFLFMFSETSLKCEISIQIQNKGTQAPRKGTTTRNEQEKVKMTLQCPIKSKVSFVCKLLISLNKTNLQYISLDIAMSSSLSPACS